jgi:peptide/nickel transport system permease protein
MTRYIVRRVLIFIPTLFIITLLAFIINVNAPGDPVSRMSGAYSAEQEAGFGTNFTSSESYWNEKLGLNLPLFYIAVTPLSVSDDLYSIVLPEEQGSVKKMMVRSGSPEDVMHLYRLIKNALVSESVSGEKGHLLNMLLRKGDDTGWDEYLRLYPSDPLAISYKELINENNTWKSYIPAIRIHPDNQYHRWMFGDGNWITGGGSTISKGVIRGDFGLSYQTMQPITEVIGEKISWSLFFSLSSVLIAYLLSIPVGIFVATRRRSWMDRANNTFIFILYSIPSFWLATILLMVFANPDLLPWFPASGVKPPEGYSNDASFLEKVADSIPYLVLPMVCYTYSSYAFLTRTVRSSLIDNSESDYVRTAFAKGLPLYRVMTVHAFSNSLLPLITIFVNIFPLMLGGSVILETIFSIPGMGSETVNAIYNQNYPMITAIFTITGILTMTGYLFSDILYAVADPRIRIVSHEYK